MTIRVLCVASGCDRPTGALILGLIGKGVDLEFICPRESLEYGRIDQNLESLERAGVPVTHLSLRRNIDPAGIRIIRDRLKGKSFDILHMLGNRQLSNGLIASWGLPLKRIAYRGNPGNVSFFDPISWLRYLNPKIDRIVCVADAVRDSFFSMQPAFLRMPIERPVTIYKGHDLSWYSAPPVDLEQFGIPTDAFVIGCVANDRPRKGLDVLIEAAGHLPTDRPIHLLLVGRIENQSLLRLISASPVCDRIHLTGFREDAPALMGSCDVFVLPVKKREGLSRAAIEAMAYATMPIVTDSGGNTELIEHGVSGLVVPPNNARAIADAVHAVLDDTEGRRRMGKAAQDRLRQKFSVQNTVAKTFELYEELLVST